MASARTGTRRTGAGLVGALVLAACASAVPDERARSAPPLRALGRIDPRVVREPSGLVASRRHRGVLWTHGDSGAGPYLFAVDREGRVLGRYLVEGVRAVDWEDVAADEAGHLYVGDVGNNFSSRGDLAVHRVVEPSRLAETGTLRADLTVRFRYADQRPGLPLADPNFDAEALFWMDGSLWILTKHRVGTGTRLYRLPVGPGEEVRTLAPVATYVVDARATAPRALPPDARAPGPLSLRGTVTGADFDARRGMLVVLAYDALHVFRATGTGSGPLDPVATWPLGRSGLGQAESVAIDGPDVLLGDEAGRLFAVPAATVLAPPPVSR